MEPNFSREQLLAEWEAAHGRMTRKLKDKFLTRQELRELALYPEGIVKTAIQSHPRLRKILVEARRMKPSIKFAVEKMMPESTTIQISSPALFPSLETLEQQEFQDESVNVTERAKKPS